MQRPLSLVQNFVVRPVEGYLSAEDLNFARDCDPGGGLQGPGQVPLTEPSDTKASRVVADYGFGVGAASAGSALHIGGLPDGPHNGTQLVRNQLGDFDDV